MEVYELAYQVIPSNSAETGGFPPLGLLVNGSLQLFTELEFINAYYRVILSRYNGSTPSDLKIINNNNEDIFEKKNGLFFNGKPAFEELMKDVGVKIDYNTKRISISYKRYMIFEMTFDNYIWKFQH